MLLLGSRQQKASQPTQISAGGCSVVGGSPPGEAKCSPSCLQDMSPRPESPSAPSFTGHLALLELPSCAAGRPGCCAGGAAVGEAALGPPRGAAAPRHPVPHSAIPALSSVTRGPSGGVASHYFHWLPLALAPASVIWDVLDLSGRDRRAL